MCQRSFRNHPEATVAQLVHECAGQCATICPASTSNLFSCTQLWGQRAGSDHPGAPIVKKLAVAVRVINRIVRVVPNQLFWWWYGSSERSAHRAGPHSCRQTRDPPLFEKPLILPEGGQYDTEQVQDGENAHIRKTQLAATETALQVMCSHTCSRSCPAVSPSARQPWSTRQNQPRLGCGKVDTACRQPGVTSTFHTRHGCCFRIERYLRVEGGEHSACGSIHMRIGRPQVHSRGAKGDACTLEKDCRIAVNASACTVDQHRNLICSAHPCEPVRP